MKTLLTIACLLILADPAEAQTRKKGASAATNASETQEKKTTKKSGGTSATSTSKTGKSDGATKPAAEKEDSSKAGKSEQIASTLKRSTTIPSGKKKASDVAKDAASAPADDAEPRKSIPATGAKRQASAPSYDAGEDLPSETKEQFGPNITLDPGDLADFDRQPATVRQLLQLGLSLTLKDLTYRYGSADPSSGGMDCSGTIYYLLKAVGIKDPPRDSTGLYLWTEREGTLRRVSPMTLKDTAMDDLRPGDLLFWEGTYSVLRNPPISHTMIYLGREKRTGWPVMVGASDGRTYAGVRRNGVSVFDFKLPRAGSPARFVGYARVPGLVR